MGFHRSHDRIVQVDATGQYIFWTDPRISMDKDGGEEDGVTNKIALEDVLSVTCGERASRLKKRLINPSLYRCGYGRFTILCVKSDGCRAMLLSVHVAEDIRLRVRHGGGEG